MPALMMITMFVCDGDDGDDDGNVHGGDDWDDESRSGEEFCVFFPVLAEFRLPSTFADCGIL